MSSTSGFSSSLSGSSSSGSKMEAIPELDDDAQRHFAPANSGLVAENAIPGAKPSPNSVIDLAQFDKAYREIKDGNLREIADNEAKFFRMAAAIVAQSLRTNNGANAEAYDMIRINYGNGIDGITKLAALLREVAMKKKMDEVLTQVTEGSLVTNGDDRAVGKVSVGLKGKSPFRF